MLTLNEEFKDAKLVISDLGEPDKNFELIRGNSFGLKFVGVELLSKIIGS